MNVQTLSKYAPQIAQTILGEDGVLPMRIIHDMAPTGGAVWYETTAPVPGVTGISGLGSRIVILGTGYVPCAGIVPALSGMEKCRRDLERLKDGWNGVGSLAPTPAILADLDHVLTALPEGATAPEVEVDEDTGHVTFRWQDNGASSALSIVISGTKQILAVSTSLGANPFATSRRFDVTNGDAIAHFFDRNNQAAEVLVHG